MTFLFCPLNGHLVSDSAERKGWDWSVAGPEEDGEGKKVGAGAGKGVSASFGKMQRCWKTVTETNAAGCPARFFPP